MQIDLAHSIGTNDTYLKKHFKIVFGTTVFAHLLQFKMNKAMQLLKEGYFYMRNAKHRLETMADMMQCREFNYIRSMFDNTLFLIKLKTLCKLHFEGRGTKYISMITGVPRKVVQKNIQKLKELNHLTKDDIMRMDNRELMRLFG